MRTSRLLSFYLSREILQYGFVSFVALTTILVCQNTLRRLDDLVAIGITFDDFLSVVGYLVPMLAAYTLPVSFLFGVFFAVSRMAADDETVAMGAAGLGPSALLLPTIVLGILYSMISGFLMNSVEHRAHRAMRTLVETLAARGGILESGRFHSLANRTLFVQERDHENRLRGVMISDQSDPDRPLIIFAEAGHFDLDEDAGLVKLGLSKGAIHLLGEATDSDTSNRISFDELEYDLDVGPLLRRLGAAVRPRQMSSAELRDVLRRVNSGANLKSLDQKKPIEYELELHRRYAFPLAPLLFGLVAVPLGVGRAAGNRSRGALWSLLIAFSYYALTLQARFFAREGWMPVWFAFWLPNLVFAGFAMLLVRRSRGTPS